MPRITRTDDERRLIASAGADFLESLARALRVIQAFNRDRRQLTLSDIARLVGLPRASVRRTLHTLVHLGFAETDGPLFRLTPRILTLASAYLSSNAIADIIQPALERLSEEINQSCSAAVLDRDEAVIVSHASPNRIIPVSGQIGLRLPAVSSSLGRVLLASLDDHRLEEFLARVQPKKLTKFTVIDKRELRKAIEAARTDGFALVDQEVEVGFRSISVPLKRSDGRTIAAMNVGVHSAIPLATMRSYLPKLRALAAQLKPQMI
jgi:IclR family pca regulon transcriptional regulator